MTQERDAVIELIDRFERHKAAVLGQSELEIGSRTVAKDYDDAIRMLNYLRNACIEDVKNRKARR